MSTRNYALTLGVVFVLLGIFGFIPGMLQAPLVSDPNLLINAGYARLWGIFPVNVIHNLFRLALGVWGIAAAFQREPLTQSGRARSTGPLSYTRSVATITAIATVMGIFPVLNTVFGLMPIFGHSIWLHAIIAAASYYFGYRRPEMVDRVTTTVDDIRRSA